MAAALHRASSNQYDQASRLLREWRDTPIGSRLMEAGPLGERQAPVLPILLTGEELGASGPNPAVFAGSSASSRWLPLVS